MAEIARLGVLGGTFDPIHVGHLLMAQTAYEALALDRVLFVPAGVPPHKRKAERLAAATRLELARAAVADDCRFRVSTVDMDRPGPHYSVDTVALLADQFGLGPDAIFFVVGSDSLEQFHTWRLPALLVQRCVLAVIDRPGHDVDLGGVCDRVPAALGRVIRLEMPAVGISSTWLRRVASQGRSLRYWVPPAVEAIIRDQGLYRSAQPGVQAAGS